MEDFIERVGESYLERKAFALPQQLENLAKKQLSGGGEEGAKAKKSTEKGKTSKKGEEEEEEEGEGEEREPTVKKKKNGSGKAAGSSEKDKEIARLKKQLARSKLVESPKTSAGKSTSRSKESGTSRTLNGRKAVTKKAVKGDKGMKELVALEAAGAVGGTHEEKKSKSADKDSRGSRLAKEANIVEISPPKRKTSTSQHKEPGSGAKSELGAGSKSGHGGHAKSTTSHAAAASEGKRRPSKAASQSAHGDTTKSTTKSTAHAPIHEQLPAHTENAREERTMVEMRRPKTEYEQEGELYVVEVEEEVPRRRRRDTSSVVEVECSKGRTVYRV